jgi:site-specific recombinase XerD
MVRPLHIAASIKIVSEHRNMPGMTVDMTRNEIKRLATGSGETPDDIRLRVHLERSTGMRIKELAKLTEQWPKNV